MKLWKNNPGEGMTTTQKTTGTHPVPKNAKELLAGLPEEQRMTIEVRPFAGSETYELTVKSRLGFDEVLGFVELVLNVCINGDDSSYHPELFQFAIRLATLQYYAGLSLADMTTDEMWRLAFDTFCWRQVRDHIDADQFGYLYDSALQQVAYHRDTMASAAARRVDDMLNQLMGMIGGIDQTVADLKSPEIQSALDRIADFGKKTEGKNQNG